eukprot:TRINITY_DN65587_c0_g1_i1.p1 TRINITY_DN65587_c0_g1~~TRINITY_DN65587_c0_g1_i1.p1  ORF type:complete len:443 (+),score=70.23 TRINITY_DN65587_c0_g1_i1:44-1372(+)
MDRWQTSGRVLGAQQELPTPPVCRIQSGGRDTIQEGGISGSRSHASASGTSNSDALPRNDQPEDIFFCRGPLVGACKLCAKDGPGNNSRCCFIRAGSSENYRTLRHFLFSVFLSQFVFLAVVILQFATVEGAHRRRKCSAFLMVWAAIVLTIASFAALHRVSGPFFLWAFKRFEEGAANTARQRTTLKVISCLACLQQGVAALGAFGLLALAVYVADLCGLDAKELLQVLGQETSQPSQATPSTAPSADRTALRGSGERVQVKEAPEYGIGVHVIALSLAASGMVICCVWCRGLSRQLKEQEVEALRSERRAVRQTLSGAVLTFNEILEVNRPGPRTPQGVMDIVEQLEVVENQTEMEAECSICAEEFDGQIEVRRAQCGHHFHSECIAQWLLRSPTCPLCRKDLLIEMEAKRLESELARLIGGSPMMLLEQPSGRPRRVEC